MIRELRVNPRYGTKIRRDIDAPDTPRPTVWADRSTSDSPAGTMPVEALRPISRQAELFNRPTDTKPRSPFRAKRPQTRLALR